MPNGRAVDFLLAGKRKPARFFKSGYKPFLLLLPGVDHPMPADMMVPASNPSPGLECTVSRYASFDARFITDFNLLINGYLSREGIVPIFDARWTTSSDLREVDPELAEFIENES